MNTTTTTKPWADEPFDLLSFSLVQPKEGEKTSPSTEIAADIIIIHNTLIRGLNAVYLQCVNIERSPSDIKDLVEFAQVWAEMVLKHHDTGEDMLFPSLEKLVREFGVMAKNIE